MQNLIKFSPILLCVLFLFFKIKLFMTYFKMYLICSCSQKFDNGSTMISFCENTHTALVCNTKDSFLYYGVITA